MSKMICSEWLNCKDLECPTRKAHICDDSCRAWETDEDCPYPCIPYEEPCTTSRCLEDIAECCAVYLPAPQMPLDDLDNEISESICSACLSGMQRDTCPYTQPCDGLHDALINIKLLVKAWLSAHDTAIRKEAVKEFAERLCASKYPFDKGDKSHIRAMAGKE